MEWRRHLAKARRCCSPSDSMLAQSVTLSSGLLPLLPFAPLPSLVAVRSSTPVSRTVLSAAVSSSSLGIGRSSEVLEVPLALPPLLLVAELLTVLPLPLSSALLQSTYRG